jgi:hypothetical protein
MYKNHYFSYNTTVDDEHMLRQQRCASFRLILNSSILLFTRRRLIDISPCSPPPAVQEPHTSSFMTRALVDGRPLQGLLRRDQ